MHCKIIGSPVFVRRVNRALGHLQKCEIAKNLVVNHIPSVIEVRPRTRRVPLKRRYRTSKTLFIDSISAKITPLAFASFLANEAKFNERHFKKSFKRRAFSAIWPNRRQEFELELECMVFQAEILEAMGGSAALRTNLLFMVEVFRLGKFPKKMRDWLEFSC